MTTTTHKTLRGPRGGMIMCKEAVCQGRSIRRCSPASQGGPLMHVIAGKGGVRLARRFRPNLRNTRSRSSKTRRQWRTNLSKCGVRLVSGGTDNHLMLVDLRDKNMTGKELEKMLDEVNITVNKNTIPFEETSPFITSGIRIGTPSITSRGFKEEDARQIARLISKIIAEKEGAFDYVRAEVKKLCEKYPLYANDIL